MLSLLFALLAFGQETAVPKTPVPSTITSYKIISFSQEREPDWRFTITYMDNNGKIYQDLHYGLTSRPNPAGGPPINNPEGADTLLKQMNTMNFSGANPSLIKRLFQHLEAHGKIPPMTVTGVPEQAVLLREPLNHAELWVIDPLSIVSGEIQTDKIKAQTWPGFIETNWISVDQLKKGKQ